MLPRSTRAADLFEAAVLLSPDERQGFVRQACAGDAELQAEVESMLAAGEDSLIVDRPVDEAAATLLGGTASLSGRRVGAFQVEGLLGAGGMGEVYRATDTVLGRQVAIKVLPAAVAGNPDRLARFRREAKLLAALNHPHVGTIYGVESLQAGNAGTFGLVLELIEGPTLADRLKAGRIAMVDALDIARQIASALDAAHQQGIVHRDLKPGNIKLRDDGTVKVLDFGLAKLADSNPSEAARLSDLSPTVTSPAILSGVGVLLGTAAYMSPEQAKGRPADKRSDIWAFGCVLYEMLAGRRAFDGDDITEVLGAVVRLEPDWSALPVNLPPALRTLIQGCLTKDARHRIGDVSTVQFVLAQYGRLDPAAPAAQMSPARPLWRRVAVPIAAAAAAAVMAATAVWFLTRPGPAGVTRFTLTPEGPLMLRVDPVSRDLSVLADGSGLVYNAFGTPGTGAQIILRRFDDLEPRVLVKGGIPRAPVSSPDSEWVGFIDITPLAPQLKKVPVTGGPVLTLCSLNGRSAGVTWGEDGYLVFATENPSTGLQRVRDAGGEPELLTTPDAARGEGDHLWPQHIPGRRAVLFTITRAMAGIEASQVAVFDLETRTTKVVLSGGSQARYTTTGHLVYAAAGTLRAVPFDVDRLEVTGTPRPVVPEVAVLPSGTAEFDIAPDGTLIYLAAGGASPTRTLVWVDRNGVETPIQGLPRRSYMYARLSPDGTQVAVDVRDQENDIWIWDFARQTLSRLTRDRGLDRSPIWLPRGDRVVFSSQQGLDVGSQTGLGTLFAAPTNGSGALERLVAQNEGVPLMPSSVSPDGRQIVSWGGARDSVSFDVVMVSPEDGRVVPLVKTESNERNGEIAPGGRWMAYESNESGRFEIYVRPFPNVNDGGWQVSTEGGTQPAWSRSGDELFFRGADGDLRAVRVERGDTWVASPPRRVIGKAFYLGPANSGRTYDVSLDGRRFLMVKDEALEEGTLPTIIVARNWFEELARLVPR